GVHPLGSRFREVSRGQDRGTFLAFASGGPDHLFAELPPGELDARAVRRSAREQGGTRARERPRRGAAFVLRGLRPAVSDGLYDGRAPILYASQGPGWRQEDD